MPTTLLQSDLPGLTLRHRGKVRDVFDLPRERLPADAPSGAALTGDYLLMVATDRLSAFDVVLPDPIPGKGEMLCQISNFWFEKTAHLLPNHLTGIDVASVLPAGVDPALYAKRSVVTKRLKPVPVEAIARGYLIGSGWKDYQRTGAVSGIALPDGLRQAEKLPEPIFTPSTKAAVGDHDENIDFDTMVKAVGPELAERVRDATLRIYAFAADYAAAARHPAGRHQVRVRHRCRRPPVRDGRDADARLLALLAGGRVRSGHQPAELRQAVRARLSGNAGLGQDRARDRGCRRK